MNIVELRARNKAQPYQPKTDYDPSHYRFARGQSPHMRDAELEPTPPVSPALRKWLFFCAACTVAIVVGVVYGADAWRYWMQ